MDTKKILALTMIVLALFCCIGAASAGLFDFFGGGEVKNQTYTFQGFTLDIPETANVTSTNESKTGVERQSYRIKIANESDSSKTKTVSVVISQGSRVVSSIDEYISNWVSEGAKQEGNFGDWTVININGVPIQGFQNLNITITQTGYVLAKHTGSKLIILKGTDLALLKNMASTYKEV